VKDGRKRAFVVTLLATTPRDGALILSEVRVPVLSSESRAGDASGTTSRGSCGSMVGTPSSPICSRRW